MRLLQSLLLRKPHPTTWNGLYVASRFLPARNFYQTNSVLQPLDMETVNTTPRLSHLRELMKKNKVDVYSMTDRYFLSMYPFAKAYSCSIRR